jgi:hypothetical protein
VGKEVVERDDFVTGTKAIGEIETMKRWLTDSFYSDLPSSLSLDERKKNSFLMEW